MTIHRYKFDGISDATLNSAIASMGVKDATVSVASVPNTVYIDIEWPDGKDLQQLDTLMEFPYKFTRVGVATTPNVRVATIRVKRDAAFLVSDTPAQLPWDALSTLGPNVAISLVSGDLVPAVTGLMRIDAQAMVTPIVGQTSLTMRVIVDPGVSQYTVCESSMGPSLVQCSVQFAITANTPVRIEIEKSGGVGDATLELTESRTFCCANVIAQ